MGEDLTASGKGGVRRMGEGKIMGMFTPLLYTTRKNWFRRIFEFVIFNNSDGLACLKIPVRILVKHLVLYIKGIIVWIITTP